MNCLDAQSIISETLDGALTDPMEVRQAKEHCRGCDECGSFVRTLLALDRTPSPSPRPDLPDRIMARIRVEAQKTASQAVVASGDEVKSSGMAIAQAESGSPAQTGVNELVRRIRDPRNRKSVATWGAVAAALVVFIGWGAVAGVRQMLIPAPVTMVSLEDDASNAQLRMGAPAPETGTSQYGVAGTSAPTTTAPATATQNFITIGETVYRLVGAAPADTDLSQLSAAGTTTTRFDLGGVAQNRRVYQSPVPGRVYVDGGATVYDFERVYLTFQGKLYLLTSGPIDSFGKWPTWNGRVTKPSTLTGAPSLKEAGTTDADTSVFAPSAGGSGVALPPSPAGPAAIAGAPDWTWWQLSAN